MEPMSHRKFSEMVARGEVWLKDRPSYTRELFANPPRELLRLAGSRLLLERAVLNLMWALRSVSFAFGIFLSGCLFAKLVGMQELSLLTATINTLVLALMVGGFHLSYTAGVRGSDSEPYSRGLEIMTYILLFLAGLGVLQHNPMQLAFRPLIIMTALLLPLPCLWGAYTYVVADSFLLRLSLRSKAVYAYLLNEHMLESRQPLMRIRYEYQPDHLAGE